MINNNLLNATTEIQSAIRTYMAQQEAQVFLPAIRYLKHSQPKDWKSLPTSLSGTTNVYFPDELPRIVLKDIGNTIHARDRMTNMDLGHRLCKDQGLRTLVVPKAHFYSSKGVGIEERLPIGDTLSFFKNIHFYYKHRDELTQAIADFTRFHFFLQTEDILEKHTEDTHGIRSLLKQKDPYSIRRSDNLPIYRDKDGSYKFGLIDLEFVNDHGPQPTLDKVIRSAEEVTTLFPYHTHTVAKVLSIYCKERSFTETDYFQGIARLINARSLSIKLYYGVIEGHLKFLENHRINPQNAHQFAPFYSTDRRSICDNLLSSDLFHHLYPEKGDAATIERWLDGMIDHLISMTPKSVDSLADLAEARCGHYHFEKALSALIKKECCVLFKGLRGRSLSLFCKRLNQALLAELRLRGLIYHYAPIQNSSIFCVLW